MAHYAKVEDGVVTQVIVADLDFIETLDGQWIKTSYNMQGGKYCDPDTGEPVEDQSVVAGDEARERKNYARIDWLYDGVGFYEPQPIPSWTFNSDAYIWEAPIPQPDDGNEYYWDEDLYQSDNTQGWVQW